MKKGLKGELLATFQQKAIGSEDELKSYYVMLKEQLEKRMTDFASNNQRRWMRYYEEVFEEASREMR